VTHTGISSKNREHFEKYFSGPCRHLGTALFSFASANQSHGQSEHEYLQAREIRVEYETHAAVSVAFDRLGALLVAYCVRARIPISRQADKDIRIEAGSVFLTFATHFADVPATW